MQTKIRPTAATIYEMKGLVSDRIYEAQKVETSYTYNQVDGYGTTWTRTVTDVNYLFKMDNGQPTTMANEHFVEVN